MDIPSNIAKIKIDRSGTISLNEEKVTLDGLKEALVESKKSNGVVWYYREDSEHELQPGVNSIIQAVMGILTTVGMPVKLSSRPDYSDYIDEEGRSISSQDGDAAPKYSEPDGEASYANCLLVTLAKGPRKPVTIVEGKALPDLASLSIDDPNEQEWIAKLPFNYQTLKAHQVIDILLHAAGFRWYKFWKSSGILPALLALPNNQSRNVAFKLFLSEPTRGARRLRITKYY
jgi:hypothetical protein